MVIGADGLVLTIGYLILEADHVDLVDGNGRHLPARVVAYDLASGFGLLQALAPLPLEPVPLGVSAAVKGDEPLLIASGGDDGDLSLARMVSRRPFSGYWEYHIDGALFTAPARTDHSGAGLFNAEGELVGIGSLVVTDAAGNATMPVRGNMFVPVDLLKPILAEMRASGASRASTRPWLGLNCVEYGGHVRVIRLTAGQPGRGRGPAARRPDHRHRRHPGRRPRLVLQDALARLARRARRRPRGEARRRVAPPDGALGRPDEDPEPAAGRLAPAAA